MSAATSFDFNALLVFAAVAEQGGFTAAADRLGITKAKASLVVRRLEAQVGHNLFARTTRRVALTSTGRALYDQCIPPLRSVEESLGEFGRSQALSGPLRIAVPLEYAGQIASHGVAAFAAAHPALDIDLRASDRVVDLLQEGIDVALRLGWLRDSTMRAVRLGGFDQYVVAAPGYLANAPKIARPDDLAQHRWVALSLLQTPLTWKFTSTRGRARTVRMNARLRTDSVAALRGLLLAGAGVSALDEFSAADALRDGTLVRVLPQWQLKRGGIHAVFPPGRYVPAKARVFAEFFKDWLASR
jgi:DNA-binding transcriptional LysR family regulator